MTTTYKIEKNIPVPSRHIRYKYPFYMMKVGDSVVLPKKGAAAASGYGRRHKMKFARRLVGKDKFRVWRVK